MTDDLSPLDTHNSHYRLQLAVQRSQTTIEQVDKSRRSHSYSSTQRSLILAEDAHRELLATITDCLPHLDTYYSGGRPFMRWVRDCWESEPLRYLLLVVGLPVAITLAAFFLLDPQ